MTDLRQEEDFAVNLTNGYAFNLVFGDERNKSILIDFLQRVLKCRVEELSIRQNETLHTAPSNELGLVNLKARIKDESTENVEIQLRWIRENPERSLYYWFEMFSNSVRKIMTYIDAKRCITINFIEEGYTINNRLHSIFKFFDSENHQQLTDLLEIHFFNLEKLKAGEHEETDTNLLNWLRFIQSSDPKERESLSKEMPALEDANKVMESIYTDPQKRENYKARQKAERDYLALLRQIELSEEKGLEDGIKNGLEKGLKKGREEGVELVVLAIQMKQGGESLEAIKKATGLENDVLAKLGIS
ncbi:MAG: Rpn family recombination-promoting nuclease/putative transposase [Bradymonadales bacterium]|jgi:predicted transposase/invertase (TIGR01784 family)